MEVQVAAVLDRLKPHPQADKHRSRVLRHVRNIVRSTVPDAVVCAFGSVPLKTYLPHGDLDLTLFTAQTGECLNGIADSLRAQAHNESAQFVVRDVVAVNHDRVEVKVVKCVVDDVPVDISVNQAGGLRTLSFLENFDRAVPVKHLYKESLLLAKGWCYFESRILGSQHGLIATYALETLVLGIVNMFHATLKTPLEVLHKFLEYYSTFDWETHCVTIYGPVPLSEVSTAEPIRQAGATLVDDAFVTPFKTEDERGFSLKFMNVLDPLSSSNNLGRSVSRGNFLRIRRALSFGLKTLEAVTQAGAHGDLMSFYRCTLRALGGGPGDDMTRRNRPDLGAPDVGGYRSSWTATASEAGSNEPLESASTVSLGERLFSDHGWCDADTEKSTVVNNKVNNNNSKHLDNNVDVGSAEAVARLLNSTTSRRDGLDWVIPVNMVENIQENNVASPSGVWSGDDGREDKLHVGGSTLAGVDANEHDEDDDVHTGHGSEVAIDISDDEENNGGGKLSSGMLQRAFALQACNEEKEAFCGGEDILSADLLLITKQLESATAMRIAPPSPPKPTVVRQSIPSTTATAASVWVDSAFLQGDGAVGKPPVARANNRRSTRAASRKLEFVAEPPPPNTDCAFEFPSLGGN